MKHIFLVLAVCCFAYSQTSAITPNKLLSRGVTALTSEENTSYITDGSLTNWKQCTAKDIALLIGEGADSLLITWESLGDCAWATDFTSGCSHSGTPLRNFKILTSANSTDGQDGDWDVAAVIENNPVMSRAVPINFSGKSWIRFVSEEEVGQILEIEAFDISDNGNDTWFFMGTSISQMGLKQQETDSTIADLIHARFPEHTPAMLRGGIGCINSTEVTSRISDYLKYAGNVNFWAIEMGTNDAWGGGDWNAENFRKNMQTIIDSAKANGITPVLARIIATDPNKANWQVNPKFLQIIDELTESNNLPKGPDFFSFFSEHPELLASDGVHPNGETGGGQAMHHLWAEALANLYADSESTDAKQKEAISIPQILVNRRQISVSGLSGSTCLMQITSMNGNVLETHSLSKNNSSAVTNVPKGNYIVTIKASECSISSKVFIGE